MSNRLASETSPYLLQHADNPVDWYPWGDEAFELARASGKPVLLSIGYSACHWCHVMAHESFEHEATAALMNERFINIKVDREERPDIDKIYQTAHQLLTQRGGGWPLTMFLNPIDQKPYFGGTYFPREARYGMPAFGDLLSNVADFFDQRPDDIREQGERLSEIFQRLEPPAPEAGTEPDAKPLAELRKRLEEVFDSDYGGFAAAPKFPHPATIERLLRHWRASAADAEPDLHALYMATLTLTRMAEGGLYDHLGGGFCRYSVDRFWEIPHFEKMLYDNGPLLAAYAQAHLATGEPLFRSAATGTASWMLEDMQADNGGFFSSRDADSEGEEGRFYVWTPEQVETLLDASDAAVFNTRFGLDQPANFEGAWHLAVKASVDEVAKSSGLDSDAVTESLARSRTRLLRERSERIAPERDDKQLTSWNALAIRGLAIAGRALETPALIDAAEAAARFLQDNLLVDGQLQASYKDGRARFNAYLDDHAFLIDALLELLQSRWDTRYLNFAIELADALLERFEDHDSGGFYFTANDHETLMHRARPLADDAMPSGNGIAAFALQRLGHLTGELRFNAAAERTLKAAWRAMADFPHGHVTLITALEESLQPPEIVILRGAAEEVDAWRDAAGRLWAPARMIFAIPDTVSDLSGLLAERKAVTGETLAYRCVGTHCELPVSSFEALAAQLKVS